MFSRGGGIDHAGRKAAVPHRFQVLAGGRALMPRRPIRLPEPAPAWEPSVEEARRHERVLMLALTDPELERREAPVLRFVREEPHRPDFYGRD